MTTQSAAVSADQLNSFLEKLDILCEKLKIEDCPICDLKLSDDKSTCVNGHGICGSCKLVVNVCPVCSAAYPGEEGAQAVSTHSPPKRFRQSEENGESMNVDENVENGDANSRKCINAARGCQVSLSESDLIAHETSCTFRLYACKICNVEFCLRKLHGHCERSHPNNVLKHSVFKIVSPNEVRVNDKLYYFLNAQNEIFWFWRNNSDRFVYFGLQFCGDAERTKEFKYSLELVSVNQKSVFKFGGPVLFDTSEMPLYSPSEDYVMVAKNFINNDSKFRVSVSKV